MKIFVSGGCKNGKSTFAQKLAARLAAGGKLYYVATMIPCDDEDRLRIKKHLENRAGMGFETIETGRGICGCLTCADRNGTFLVDSVTALLTNEMFPAEHGGTADRSAGRRCRHELVLFARSVNNAVFVSDYIFSDAERYDPLTEEYRRALADADRALASLCDTAVEMCAGVPSVLKGRLPL